VDVPDARRRLGDSGRRQRRRVLPRLGGYLNKVNAGSGVPIWSRKISDYDGVPGSVSRASPAVAGNTVYLGDQNGGYLSAVNAATGDPIWTTRVDNHPFAILTAGPLVYNGVIYQGVASLEEGAAIDPPTPAARSAAAWSRSTPIPARFSGRPTRFQRAAVPARARVRLQAAGTAAAPSGAPPSGSIQRRTRRS
jgi:PQQ enzyme repeat